jgi:palmitoyltransferase
MKRVESKKKKTDHHSDPNLSWPPPDPDRIPRLSIVRTEEGPFSVQHFDTVDEEIAAFRHRQREDMQRWNISNHHNYNIHRTSAGLLQRRKKFHERHEVTDVNNTDPALEEPDSSRGTFSISNYDSDDLDENNDGHHHTNDEERDEGEESWQNAEGERLRDFGVDEDVEFYDEDDVPLARLIKRNQEKGGRNRELSGVE